jgi:signal transduction histidine kinase/ligand-binding sensor domain-containing protein
MKERFSALNFHILSSRLAAQSFIFLLFFCSFVQSQEIAAPQNFHQWGAVTIFNGLPSDNVRAIAQTPDGILWFGTENGLARFDGRRVQTETRLESNKILALEGGGEMWIGTDTGAARFENGKFHLIEETRGKAITTILPGETTILISSDAVFAASRNPNNSLETVNLINRPLEFSAAERIGENVLFGSRGRGLIVQNGTEAQELMSRPRPFFINVLERDSSGALWIGAKADNSTSGLFWAKDVFRPVRIGENIGTVTTIFAAKNGDLWVGTEKNGLFRFRGQEQLEHFTFENTAGGLRSNTIYAIFADRENVVWTGTNRGVSRFDASSPDNQTLSENGNSNFVRTIFRSSDGRIFAGTNRGLFALDGNAWREIEGFASKPVYSVAEDAAKQILIAAPSGLFGFDGKVKTNGDTRAVAEFRGKTYAAIFGRGVVEIETQTAIFINDAATAIFADPEKLWIGTARGEVFTFDGKETRQEKSPEILRGAAIRKIAASGAGEKYFSGERGLFRLIGDRTETIVADEDVRDFAFNGSDVWAATLRRGLLHLRFDENFGWISTDLNVEQGLPSEQIFAVLPVENRMLIGTNRGVSVYAPGTVAPQIISTRVLSQRLHDPNEISGTIALEYPQNSLLVEVAGLSSRTFPEQFQYGFTLKNGNGEVLDKKLSNEAQFSVADLQAGAYRVEARAFNKDLLTSEPLIINFTVARAPFPLTATALGVLLAIASAGLIWAVVERRRIRRANRELARARFDLANEAERERRRIARDLHDQTLADLRNLMMMSDQMPSENAEFRKEIESVSTEIRRICEDLSPSVLENVGLAAALEFLLHQTTQYQRFSAPEDLEENLNFSPHTQIQIYRIAQEILTNIKRHSDAEFIEMTIEISPESEFVLTITDDGKSFNPDAIVTKNRGVANIKSRAALINAKIAWENLDDGRNTFRLKK